MALRCQNQGDFADDTPPVCQLQAAIRPDRQGMTVRWALMELTGESIPEPKGPTLPDSAGWFLESLDDQ